LLLIFCGCKTKVANINSNAMNNDAYIDDRKLWTLVKSGDKEAFSLLYERNIKELYNYCAKLTQDHSLIKDILQELFIEIWNKQQTLSEVNHVKVYLMSCARYKLLKAKDLNLKKNTLYIEDILKEIEMPDADDDDTTAQRRDQLANELNNLPERQKEVLHLKYFQNLDNDQISSIININYQSVSNLIHRALSNLKGKILR
jgi:RNA polymerase sigma factor (sigma-70 family)